MSPTARLPVFFFSLLVASALLAPAARGQLVITPASIDFGDVEIGDSLTVEVTVANPTPTPIEYNFAYIGSLGKTGDAQGISAYSLVEPGEQIIPAGGSISLFVTFKPPFTGPHLDDLFIYSIGFDVEDIVPLQGTGVNPSLDVAPLLLDFGDVEVGTELVQDVTVTNNTAFPVFYELVEILGLEEFSVEDPGPQTLAPGVSLFIPVTFAPTNTLQQEATLRIASSISQLELDLENLVTLQGRGFIPAPDIDVTPQALTFGELAVGESTSRSLTITNEGTAALDIASFDLTGGAEAVASFQPPEFGFSVPVDQSVEVTVLFEPTVPGTLTADLTIVSNDPDEPNVVIPLTGVGLAGTQTIDFGEVVLGQSRVLDVLVRHNGAAPLQAFASLTEDPTGSYSVDPLAVLINPGEDGRFSITLTPQARGLLTGALVIESQQAPLLFIRLTGVGTAPRIEVPVQAIDFGEAPLGTPVVRSLRIRNGGDAPLELIGPFIEGGNSQFRITNGGGTETLQPGATHTLELTFTAAAQGVQVAELFLPNNDPDRPQPIVALRGTGACGFMISETAVDFGDVTVGQTASRDLVLSQTCSQDLTVNVTQSGSSAFSTDAGTSFVLPPGENRTVSVTFLSARGPQAGTLRFTSADFPGLFVEVTLAGQGVEPNVVVSAAQLDFGVVTLGRTVARPLRVSNTGNAPLELTALSLGGAGAAVFSLDDGSPSVLEPGAERVLGVSFAPDADAAFTATLRVASNDPDTPTLDVSLQGRGAVIQNQTPDVVDAGTAVTAVFVLPADLQGATGQLGYRRGGETAFQTTPFTANGTTYQATIPVSAVTARGVEYAATFRIGNETLRVPAQGAALIRVRVPEVTAEGALEPEQYRMLSIPYDLLDPSISAVFSVFGPPDPNVWRALRWLPQNGAYIDYGNAQGESRIQPGEGFWLITQDGGGFDVVDARSVDTSEPFTLALESGWNQIGGPFPFPVAWEQILSFSGVFLQNPVAYTGTAYAYNCQVLLPWEGYFVWNPGGPVTLQIPPVESPVPFTNCAVSLPEETYTLQLVAEAPALGLRDAQTYLGLTRTDGAVPRTDLVEAPAIGDHVNLSVVEDGTRFVRRTKSMQGDGQQWDLELTAATQGGQRLAVEAVDVHLVEHGARPDDFAFYVLDRDRGRAIPVEGGRFTVDVAATQPVRHLSVIVGTRAFAEANSEGVSLTPTDFVLEQNYPNPFNPETVIRYGLSEQGPVTLIVYNLLGQEVRTLVDAQQAAGRYAVTWDALDDRGQPVASGLYVYRLHTGDATLSRKMLLMR